MSERSDIATKMFLSGYNCAQSVLYAFRDESGLPKGIALKIACGLGAGMARKQEVCGAVTGGILVLGMRHGRGVDDDRSARDLTYRRSRELMERFAEKHGSYICGKLLNGFDLTTDEGREQYKENDLKNKVCVMCVKSTVELLEELR
jgi:C_GCAxxG_C_C family probable redox protein